AVAVRVLVAVGVGSAGTSSASASRPGGRLPRDVIAPVVGLMAIRSAAKVADPQAKVPPESGRTPSRVVPAESVVSAAMARPVVPCRGMLVVSPPVAGFRVRSVPLSPDNAAQSVAVADESGRKLRPPPH